MIKKTLFVLFNFLLIKINCIAQLDKRLENFKGTWITNVGSNALLDPIHIDSTIEICKKNNINHIFVVVWNNGQTMYPSKVVNNYIGIPQNKVYKGFDPIEYIIQKAHQQNIYVHAWLEFGFSYSYNDSNSIWKQKYPHWIGKNKLNKPLKKNNFYWWNPNHPEVKKFILQLVEEVVNKYDFDGIQGDDRLPANPVEGGYDEFTKTLYHRAFNQFPPADEHNQKWLQWRADKLSEFAKELFLFIKQIKPTMMISWSPNIYPWSKENYLQDWPKWIQNNYYDFIIPQLYRYNVTAYYKTIQDLKKQISKEQQNKVFPGILTALANGYLIDQQVFNEMIKLNRENGFNGECLFYFECLKKIKYY